MKNAANEIGTGIRDMFTECGERTERIKALYTEERALARKANPTTADEDRRVVLIADIASEGLRLAAAFEGMLMIGKLGQILGVDPQDAMRAARGETRDPIDAVATVKDDDSN